MQPTLQANLNHIPPTMLQQLAVLAQQDGLNLEEYHERMIATWLKNPIRFRQNSPKITSSGTALTPEQAQIPNVEQAIADSPNFVKAILAMPKIDGHDDLFERSQDSRDLDFDDLYFGEKVDVSH